MSRAALPRGSRTGWQRFVLGLAATAWSALAALAGWADVQIVTFTTWLGDGSTMSWIIGGLAAGIVAIVPFTLAYAYVAPRLGDRRRAWCDLQRRRLLGHRMRARADRIDAERARRDGPVRVESVRVGEVAR